METKHESTLASELIDAVVFHAKLYAKMAFHEGAAAAYQDARMFAPKQWENDESICLLMKVTVSTYFIARGKPGLF